MTKTLKQLVVVLNKEREAYANVADMASDIGVPYDTLYALLNGSRTRGVNLDMLLTLAKRFPSVGALFLSPDSQVRSDDLAEPQEVSA